MVKTPGNEAKASKASKPDNGGAFGKVLKSLTSRRAAAAGKAAGRGKRSI